MRFIEILTENMEQYLEHEKIESEERKERNEIHTQPNNIVWTLI